VKALRPVRVEGDTVIIPLGARVGGTCGLTAVADAKFASEIGCFNWSRLGTRSNLQYAAGSGASPHLLHRFVWFLEHGYVPEKLDHRDRNGLDCRLRNLRPASAVENNWNSKRRADNVSGYKGVKPERRSVRSPWRADIHNAVGKQLYLGSFATAEAAARAYDRAARRLFGEFAVLNFPDEDSRFIRPQVKLEVLKDVRALVSQNPNLSTNEAYQRAMSEMNKQLLPLWRSECMLRDCGQAARLKLLDDEIRRITEMEK
jgi:hypothetical protein